MMQTLQVFLSYELADVTVNERSWVPFQWTVFTKLIVTKINVLGTNKSKFKSGQEISDCVALRKLPNFSGRLFLSIK